MNFGKIAMIGVFSLMTLGGISGLMLVGYIILVHGG
ncbi:protein YohO [Symbiopectobacterium purcellii]